MPKPRARYRAMPSKEISSEYDYSRRHDIRRQDRECRIYRGGFFFWKRDCYRRVQMMRELSHSGDSSKFSDFSWAISAVTSYFGEDLTNCAPDPKYLTGDLQARSNNEYSLANAE